VIESEVFRKMQRETERYGVQRHVQGQAALYRTPMFWSSGTPQCGLLFEGERERDIKTVQSAQR
jgi:hypothetical protein